MGVEDIDFNILSLPDKPLTPWSALRIALSITFSLFLIIGSSGLLTYKFISNSETRANVMAVVSGTLIFIFLGWIVHAFIMMFRKLGRQKSQAAVLAQKCGWEYDGENVQAGVDELPESFGIGRGAIRRFIIRGTVDDQPFEYYQLVVPTNVMGNQSLAPLGIIRRPGIIVPKDTTTTAYYSNNGMYTYVIYSGNALTRDSLKGLFQEAFN